LSPGLDGEKFFIVARGEAVKRIDAFYWQPKFHVLDTIFARYPDWTVRLGSIATGITNGDHGGVEYTDKGVRYLRGQSVTEFGLDLAKDQRFISEAEHSRMVRAEVLSGDVLYTIAGSVGNACVVGGIDRANINQAIVRVRPFKHIIPQYLADFLNSSLGRLQGRRVANGGVQLNINFSEVRSLRILAPPLDKQRRLVDELSAARASYRSALAQAARLLESVDDYLLAELGIALPPEPENTLTNRIFTAQRRELAGWRFDPLFHSFKLWHAIETAQVPHKKLGLCCHYLKSGFAAGGDMQLFEGSGVIQLRPTNIDANREWIFEKNIYLSEATLIDRPKDIVQPGEVLFNNTNSQELVGKTVYMGIKGQSFFCSNHMTRIQTINEELNPEYLAALLNAYQRLKVFFSLCTNWNNQSGLNVDLLRQLPIPIPSLTKQAEIADHIGQIRQEAKQLRQRAQTELEAAKRRIEAMLLGAPV